MCKPITRMEMAGFRGAIDTFELELDPNKDLTILFGENGSGKSSILDAIDVVCNGGVGCLESVSIGQAPGKYLCALGCQPATLKVTIHSNAESWTGTMHGNSVSVAGVQPTPSVKILRRNRILDLVLAQPNERYRALSHFLDIGVVEASERTLQQKVSETGRAIDVLIAQQDWMSNQLDNLWEAENHPGPGQTAMAWAESRIDTGIAGLNDQLKRLKAVVDTIVAASTARSNFKTRKENHLKGAENVEAVEQQIAAAPMVSSSSAIRLLESLAMTKAYIEAEQEIDICPTCLRPIARDELLATINLELEKSAELKQLSGNRQRFQRSAELAASQVEEAQTTLIEAMRAVEEATKDREVPEVATLNIIWPSLDETNKDMDILVAICDHLESVRASVKEQYDGKQRDVNQFNSIKQLWTGIKEANDSLTDLGRIHNGLKKAHDIVHDKRVAFTQSILDSICQEADRLFQAIHPGEKIGLEKLKMDEQRRGSVLQTGVFNGHTDIPPQAVFSESHLDTLGFCVWLALAKRETPERTILLIDDIFSSVDATHLGRVIDLLSTEASNLLQVIVATHCRPWWDRSQNAHATQRVHLGSWCSTNGITAQNAPLVTGQIQQLVAEPVLDRQAVSSKSGILLESILNDLTLLYECRLPHNKLNLYTLGALLSGCSKLFSKHQLTVHIDSSWNDDLQPENWQETDAKTAFEQIVAMQFIRNQVGCHFNTPGMEIPDDDVRDFGSTTIEFVQAMCFPNCGELATKMATDGTHRRCSCSNRAVRMTPVAIY